MIVHDLIDEDFYHDKIIDSYGRYFLSEFRLVVPEFSRIGELPMGLVSYTRGKDFFVLVTQGVTLG
ncbi:MAG: hypothetical protein D3908_12595 [Candidatus Electrothrix sp. AUS4]|nr:hypothetical protein [Candidatus Electrothrix sp. AUS4]